MTISPVRLNHAVLFVADLERSVRFYTDVFGMDVIAREPRANAAFLRLPRSGNHHDLGLFGVGTAGGPKRRGAIGLYHLYGTLPFDAGVPVDAGRLRDVSVLVVHGGGDTVILCVHIEGELGRSAGQTEAIFWIDDAASFRSAMEAQGVTPTDIGVGLELSDPTGRPLRFITPPK